MLRSYITGIACLAFLCGGFWVLEYGTRRRRMKVIDHHKHGIDVEQKEDRISQLPNDLISSIVSRLPMEDAVRTSVLSRRWKHVYTFISEVRFSCYRMCSSYPSCYIRNGEKLSQLQRKFVQVVDNFLQHHSGSKIMSFELASCFRGCILDSFRRWMDSVGRLRVERLTLVYYFPNHQLQSNPPVFDFDFLPKASSVKCLRLICVSFRISNQYALKDLELIAAAFTSEAVECILLNCCSLQSLKFRACMLPSKLHIRGPDLQLKNLTVINCSNVVEIDLSAVNLTTIELCTSKMLTLSFSNVPLLQNFFIETLNRDVAPCAFEKVAKDLPHLKCMFFCTDAKFFETCEIGGVNNLSNLRQLALLLVFHSKLDLLALATILDACPLLQKFHLSMGQPSTFNGERAEKRVFRHHAQLKEVEFSGFSGTENEYSFISYILENVVSLERLSIFMGFRIYDANLECWRGIDPNGIDDKKKRGIIRERLQGLTVSKNVEIIIV
ncbi:putative F-box/FBD/LRR-repeat protein At1g78760 isoform X2 [Henckelia pumila]|uniref:putative F-box/FBD/LRR-repeat protein At1g78760 isoform X2 n=1 Tax=Henckelia pumila TaxID=405737 RepID=UPI003C6DC1B3